MQTLAIDIKNVTKQFGEKVALDGVNLEVYQGQIFGFLGPNGAGKTTTIRCILDYARPASGHISLFGKNAKENSAELKKFVGYLPADVHLHENWTVKTHLEFVGELRGDKSPLSLAEEFDIELSMKVRHLSTGNKQKLAIALAFIGSPKLLVLDEPTRGLDPLLQKQLYAKLLGFVQNGGTVFLSSHNLTEVQQLCDNVAIIKDGKIVVTESMEALHNLRLHTIRAYSTTNFNKADFIDKETEVTDVAGHSITLRTKADINNIMRKLIKYKLTHLEVTPADLEDVFLEYY